MSESTELPETDFDRQLRGLSHEAEQKLQDRAAAPITGKRETEFDALRQAEERALKSYASLPQMLRPMVQGLEAISRATGENAVALQKLDRAAVEAAEAQRSLPQLVSGLETLLEQKNGVSQRMFDALHQELKDYKDGFLFESILKPIIRDLISLYDDLTAIRRQMQDCVGEVAEAPGPSVALLSQRLKTMEMNVEHHSEFVVEILARIEVNMLPVGSGKLDKHTQRAVAVEVAEDPDEDNLIVRVLRRGFVWKDRLLRAEEVVMKKWKEGFLVAIPTSAASQQ